MTLPEPSVCPRCDGEDEILARIGTGPDYRVVPCPDCCCTCCGDHTGGGFCAECEQADWLDCELSYGRRLDR